MDDKPAPVLLLVDNDEDYLTAIAVRLAACGYECRTAHSGAQGFVTFDAENVDLVITDLNMPGGDGVHLVERIRTQSPVPIIVATGFRDDFGPQLRGIPGISIIAKPFDPDELITVIESLLALSETW